MIVKLIEFIRSDEGSRVNAAFQKVNVAHQELSGPTRLVLRCLIIKFIFSWNMI